jgi:hypothetical protein
MVLMPLQELFCDFLFNILPAAAAAGARSLFLCMQSCVSFFLTYVQRLCDIQIIAMSHFLRLLVQLVDAVVLIIEWNGRMVFFRFIMDNCFKFWVTSEDKFRSHRNKVIIAMSIVTEMIVDVGRNSLERLLTGFKPGPSENTVIQGSSCHCFSLPEGGGGGR